MCPKDADGTANSGNLEQTAGENSGGFTNWLSQQCVVLGKVLLDRKSKSLLFPGALGTVVTNDWCIKFCSF